MRAVGESSRSAGQQAAGEAGMSSAGRADQVQPTLVLTPSPRTQTLPGMSECTATNAFDLAYTASQEKAMAKTQHASVKKLSHRLVPDPLSHGIVK